MVPGTGAWPARPGRRACGTVGAMLSRRSLLAAGVSGLALTGCGVVPPGLDPSRRLPSPSPSPLPGHAALEQLRTSLADAVALPGWDGERARLITWALAVTAEQHAQTASPLPQPSTPEPSAAAPSPATATGSPAATATPSAPASPGPSDAAALVGPVVAALGTAAEAFGSQALDAAVAEPLMWASMAAWAGALSAQLPAPTASAEPSRAILRPAPVAATEALQGVLSASGEAVYALQVAAGAPGLDASTQDAVLRRVTFWLALRDDVTAMVRAASASPTPAAPWYDVDRPADTTGVRALVARVEAAALPILGRGIAYAPDDARPRLLESLAGTAADVPVWGGLLQRWPGLPVP